MRLVLGSDELACHCNIQSRQCIIVALGSSHLHNVCVNATENEMQWKVYVSQRTRTYKLRPRCGHLSGRSREDTTNNAVLTYVTVATTVEPLTNDHPHQRPSLSYDHISCDGQWFLFVYESLTSDHPSYTTTPM